MRWKMVMASLALTATLAHARSGEISDLCAPGVVSQQPRMLQHACLSPEEMAELEERRELHGWATPKQAAKMTAGAVRLTPEGMQLLTERARQ